MTPAPVSQKALCAGPSIPSNITAVQPREAGVKCHSLQEIRGLQAFGACSSVTGHHLEPAICGLNCHLHTLRQDSIKETPKAAVTKVGLVSEGSES